MVVRGPHLLVHPVSEFLTFGESKGALLTYRNNFVPASEPWLAENGQPTLRQARLNGPGA